MLGSIDRTGILQYAESRSAQSCRTPSEILRPPLRRPLPSLGRPAKARPMPRPGVAPKSAKRAEAPRPRGCPGRRGSTPCHRPIGSTRQYARARVRTPPHNQAIQPDHNFGFRQWSAVAGPDLRNPYKDRYAAQFVSSHSHHSHGTIGPAHAGRCTPQCTERQATSWRFSPEDS